MNSTYLSLSELSTQIKECIDDAFTETYWVVAEISEIKINRNGHAYLELIEKAENKDNIIARSRATIWAYTLRMLLPYFETTTNQTLSAGLKVLINVSVEYHEIYGFSLNIKNIDPTYTLGDIEQRRREIIKQLEEEGVLDMNKELELPLVIQKIAVISSPTAAGYEDFLKQLNQNQYGYKFYTKLFEAVMQGEQTSSSIMFALDTVFAYENFFDVVVIIRGGGAKADLISFDRYDLAYYITQFSLPVISGIGHFKDISIMDMVSHTSVKTPTAAAEFIINHNAEFEETLNRLFNNISNLVSDKISYEQERIDYITGNFVPKIQNFLNSENIKLSLQLEQLNSKSKYILQKEKNKINRNNLQLQNKVYYTILFKEKMFERFFEKITYRTKNQIEKNKQKLDFFETNIKSQDPANLLKKGYSITRHNGKIITDSKNVKEGDIIETVLFNGNIVSKVKNKG